MTIQQALNLGRQKLENHNSHWALETEILLAHTLQQKRAFLFTHQNQKLSLWQVIKYKYLLQKRKKHIPLAYLTKQSEFYEFKFKINKNVLVPRPETEEIISIIKEKTILPQTYLCDLGTGSGIIIITLAKLLEKKIKQYFALDISQKALQLAKENAQKHQVNIDFIQSNLCQYFLQRPKILQPAKNLIITANLPYVSSKYLQNLNQDNNQELQYEPRLALDGGPTGLKYYQQLAKELKLFKKQYPQLNIDLICEIDPQQSMAMKNIFSSYEVEIKNDLAGLNRFCIIAI